MKTKLLKKLRRRFDTREEILEETKMRKSIRSINNSINMIKNTREEDFDEIFFIKKGIEHIDEVLENNKNKK